jgi:YegS/Rv2252/BmrU family lipid kinase
MEAVFIVNPTAGRGRGAALAAGLPARCERHGIAADVRATSAPREAIRLAREAAKAGARLVVAVGGDGTAHEVVNGLAGTDTVFGLVPLGSGNDLALALGLPDDPDAALGVLAHGRDARIDLGRFDDGWFANSLGLGFEAQVTIESRKIPVLRGFAIYLAAVVKALAGLRCPRLELSVDGESHDGRRLLVCVGNGPRVGGGFLLTPEARNDDGVLDLCLVDAMGRLRVLQTLPKAISGTHTTNPRITMLRGRRIEIRSPDGFPFHADGEVYATDRRQLTLELHPGSLAVRVPRKDEP